MNLKRLVLVAFPILLIVLVAYTFLSATDDDRRTTDAYVHGNLGGMAVSLPVDLIQDLEVTEETNGSGSREKIIDSFGFYIPFPDPTMTDESAAGLILDEQRVDSGDQMLVGINTGKYYPGEGFLDKLAEANISSENSNFPLFNYEELSASEYGLDVYAVEGLDPTTNQPYRLHRDARDIFISRNENDEISTFIRCSNREVSNPPCSQFFSLAPDAKAQIQVNYSRNRLASWKEIQNFTRLLILSFEE